MLELPCEASSPCPWLPKWPCRCLRNEEELLPLPADLRIAMLICCLNQPRNLGFTGFIEQMVENDWNHQVARSIVGNIPSLTISQHVSTDIWWKGSPKNKTDSLHRFPSHGGFSIGNIKKSPCLKQTQLTSHPRITLWLCQNSYGKSPCYSWENPLFLWPFSIANCWHNQRVTHGIPSTIRGTPAPASLGCLRSWSSRKPKHTVSAPESSRELGARGSSLFRRQNQGKWWENGLKSIWLCVSKPWNPL